MNIKDIFKGVFRLIFIALVSIFAVAVLVAIVCVIRDDPQPLEVAVAVLTLLVTVIAISMGVITWWTRRDWNRFREKQEPTIRETSERLEIVKERTDELDWINTILTSVKEDPHLDSDDAKDAVESIKKHYFVDRYNEAWGYYGVARWYEKDERYEKEKRYGYAIEYYNRADAVDLEKDNDKSKELRRHIWQSLGLNYFQHGMQLEAKGKNADAIKDYEAAIDRYDWVIKYNPQFTEAHRNKAITLIQLGKIEGDKTEPYNDANYCYKEAITCLKRIEDNYDHLFDQARAYALLNQRDEAIESLKRAFKLALAELDNLGTLLKNLARYREDFKNVEEDMEFKALEKQYRDFYKGIN